MVVHPASHKIPRVPWYSGFLPIRRAFGYEGFTLFATVSHLFPLACLPFLQVRNPNSPRAFGLGSSRFARRYSGSLMRSTHEFAGQSACLGFLPLRCHRLP